MCPVEGAEGNHSTLDGKTHIAIKDANGKIIGWKTIGAALLTSLITAGVLTGLTGILKQ